jgi:hypothetical protein
MMTLACLQTSSFFQSSPTTIHQIFLPRLAGTLRNAAFVPQRVVIRQTIAERGKDKLQRSNDGVGSARYGCLFPLWW